jgi:phage terminase large subunit
VYPGGRDDPEIKLIQATVLPAFFDQEIAALFNAFIGKIYDEFSEMLHVKNFGYNPRWPNYISFDWGFTNPLAAVEFQVDPWGRVWIWREHYKANQILEAHVAELKTRQQPDGYKIDLAFGDSADPGACVYVSTHMAPCLGDPRAKLGIEAKGTRESGWREGVDLVKSYLRPRQIGIADEYGTPYEEPWLFISRNCPNTIREFNNYRAPASVGRTARNVREAAQAYDDHALDAIRYGLMHVFKLGAVYHLSDVYDLAELQESNASFFAGDINGGSGGYFDTSQLSRF